MLFSFSAKTFQGHTAAVTSLALRNFIDEEFVSASLDMTVKVSNWRTSSMSQL